MNCIYKFAVLFIAITWSLQGHTQVKKAVAHNLKSITEYEQKSEKAKLGKVLKESEIRYDTTGNVIEEMKYTNGKLDKHLVYKYDADNNRIMETELDANDNKVKVVVYKYSDGLKTEKITYNGNDQIISRKTYKYEKY
jgi:hypothetical protein